LERTDDNLNGAYIVQLTDQRLFLKKASLKYNTQIFLKPDQGSVCSPNCSHLYKA